MSKLTLEDAISHCLETAEQFEERANTPYKVEDSELQDNACRECAADHRQLAEWLTELKQWRRVYGICPSYEMCIPECKEGYDAQIAEYKRLLKLAVDDMKTLVRCDSVQDCLVCKYQLRDCDGFAFEWKHMENVNNLINPIE